MPGNITDVAIFTSPIVVPADGDAEAAASVIAGFQGLANRTALLNNTNWYGAYTLSNGVAVAGGSVFGLTLQSQVGGFTLASNQVQVPGPGTYMCSVFALLTCSAGGNPQLCSIVIRQNAVGFVLAAGQRFTASAGDSVGASASGVTVVTTPASQLIDVASQATNTTNNTGTATLVIRRIA